MAYRPRAKRRIKNGDLPGAGRVSVHLSGMSPRQAGRVASVLRLRAE